jgi:RNA polymerase sigma-70 factor (ECF subfamily)
MSTAAPTRKKVNPEQQVRAARDLRLIESYRSGRRESFDELVLSYDQHVRRILAQLSVPSGDIEDLAQEVFLRIFRNLHRFRGQSSFYTWLYRITVNVFFDHNKKRKRADVRLARLQSALVDVTNVRHDGEDPYYACFNALTRDEFWKAIDALPEAFRTVVAMREVDDLSYEEIAAQTGISYGRSSSRVRPDREPNFGSKVLCVVRPRTQSVVV